MEKADRDYIKEHFPRIAHITAVIQSEIAMKVSKDNPELLDWCSQLAQGPEEVAMETMNRQLSGVVNAMPLACLFGTNLLTTLVSVHSEMTGDMTILDAIHHNNQTRTEED